MPTKATFTFSSAKTFEENVEQWADMHHNLIKHGEGLFFDFKDMPEYEKPCLDYLINHYGWTLEKPFFIRKPEKPNYK